MTLSEDRLRLLVDNAALCRHTTGASHLFFSTEIVDIKQAKSICGSCPVAAPCLQGALDRQEPCGVWGGYLFADGQIMAHKRPRGRPPKHRPARDIIQIDLTSVLGVSSRGAATGTAS